MESFIFFRSKKFLMIQRLSEEELMGEACFESAHMNCYRIKSKEENPRLIEYKNNTKSKSWKLSTFLTSVTILTKFV